MKHSIDKVALVAEIEKLESRFQNGYDEEYADGYHYSLELVKRILDTLEVKEVDLEKEYKDFIKCDNGRSMFETAKHFFELGKKYAEEQIMSKAEKVELSNAGFAPLSSGNYKAGDKLLIIKEEQL